MNKRINIDITGIIIHLLFVAYVIGVIALLLR